MSTRRSVAEAEQDHETVSDLADLGYEPRTELGKLALAARCAYFAAGGKPLPIDQINAEIADQRERFSHLDNQ
jgi:hypothetical protein